MRKKILIVDDSETIRLMERAILARHYDVVEAIDGADAVHRALQERPDLILMDLMMPGMSGLDACRALRNRSETGAIPIIMVTTNGSAVHMREALLAGCADYLLKPVAAAELIARVRALLGEEGSPDAGAKIP